MESKKSGLFLIWNDYRKCKYLFIMLVPCLIFYLLFHYAPLYGIQLAFKDYKLMEGIQASPWVGFKHFAILFGVSSSSNDFLQALKNTVIISFYHLIFGFPAPIILALIFNELRLKLFKRVVQSLSYLPHFLSWIILGGILTYILSPSTGVVNTILQGLGFDSIYFLGDERFFRFTLVVSAIWKGVGWGTIIYLAALAGVDPHLYEAAVMDGAGRWKQTLYVTLPQMMPVIAIMFIFSIGGILNAGFDQILNLYNPAVYSVSDIIDTYVFRKGILGLQYSLTTAVGLFKNIIAFALVLLTNYLIKKMGQEGLF